MSDEKAQAISRRVFGLTSMAASVLARSAHAQTLPLPLSMAPKSDKVVTTDIPGVTVAGTEVTILKTGMTSSEGAVAAPDGGLYFTEPSVNRIYKVAVDGAITVLFDAHKVDDAKGERWRLPALGVDAKGVIYACRRAKDQIGVAIVYPLDQARFITTGFMGVPFNAPNDLVVARDGGIYFTEPGSGDQGARRPHHIFYIKPSGEVIVGTDKLGRPNGLALSPDEKTLYAVDSEAEFVWAFDVLPDHALANRRPFGRLRGVEHTDKGIISHVDGMTIDNDGRVYATSGAGVEVFAPSGENLGVIPTPINPQNLAFAGKDGRTLYMVGHGNLFKVRTLSSKVVGRAK
jgi:gluconolactonase